MSAIKQSDHSQSLYSPMVIFKVSERLTHLQQFIKTSRRNNTTCEVQFLRAV